MLGIIIGVASVVAIISIGAGAQSLITGSVQKIGTNLVAVLPGASNDKGPPASAMGISIKTLITDDALAIANLPNIEGVSAYARGSGEIVYGKESVNGNFSGITADYPLVENHPIQLGRFFTQAEERTGKKVAVLGADMKKNIFPHTDPLGKKIKINGQSFSVVGVLEKKGTTIFQNPDNQVLAPLSTVQKTVLGQKHLGLIRVKVNSEKNIQNTMEQIRYLLRQRHKIKNPADDDFSVRSLNSALDMLKGITDGLRFFLASIAAISLVVGGISIMNVMLMTVKERTREIGLKKAIGAKPSQIRNQFLLESIVLTSLGGIIGIIIGIIISWGISLAVNAMEYTWEFSLSFSAMGIAFLVSVCVGVIFGMYPAIKAAKLNPIDALRYE